MAFDSIGDLASSLLLSQANSQAKQRLVQLSAELTSGLTSDVRGRLRNDHTKQFDWEHGISKNRVLEKTLTEALTRVRSKQTVLNSISETSSTFANNVSVAISTNASIATTSLVQQAQDGLDQVLSQLNTQALGQSLFAGTFSNGPAMAGSEAILASVKSFLGNAVSATDVIMGVQNWMNDAVNGYDSVAYLGSTENLSPVRLSNDRTIDETSKANSPALRSVVENFILASFSNDQTIALTNDQRVALLQSASDSLRSARSDVTALSANLGFVEAQLTKAKVHTGTEIFAYEKLRIETLGIDEFEVASKLQETELQLEKIYTMTARSARMSLLEYLR